MQNFKDKTVAEIVTDNIKTADVFKKYGVDFCCGGKINVAKACERKGVNFDEMESELQKTYESPSHSHNFDSWDLGFLIDYIENTHHTYVVENVSLMLQYTNRVAQVHGETRPEVVRINELATDLVNELGPHLEKEEKILFPYVKEMLALKKAGKGVEQKMVESPISVMHMEHDHAGDIIKEMAKISSNFTPPAGACNTYRAMYAKLEEFQNDLFQHIHLENNILFPKAIMLEEELTLQNAI